MELCGRIRIFLVGIFCFMQIDFANGQNDFFKFSPTNETIDSLVVFSDVRVREQTLGETHIKQKKHYREIAVTKDMAIAISKMDKKKMDDTIQETLTKQIAYVLFQEYPIILFDILDFCSPIQLEMLNNSYNIKGNPFFQCTPRDGWTYKSSSSTRISRHSIISNLMTNKFIVIIVDIRTLKEKRPMISYDDSYFHSSWIDNIPNLETNRYVKVLIPIKGDD